MSVFLGLVHPGRAQAPDAWAPEPPRGQSFQTSGTYAVLLDSSGGVTEIHAFVSYGASTPSPPALPAKLPISQFRSKRPRLFTVNSRAGSGLQYRAAAFALPGGRVLVIAVPLRDVARRSSG